MSDSRRHTAIMGYGGDSEKFDKQKWHRRYRQACRRLIARGVYEMPSHREYSNVWSMNKDGKGWFGNMRFEEPSWSKWLGPEGYERHMRK